MGVPLQRLSLREFLEWENAQPDRNEYYGGEVFAMTGGRRANGRIVANLMLSIGQQLRGSRCEVYCESMKIQIADDAILYPDVFVTCDRHDLATEMIFRSPIAVIEILSPSTQAYDRSQKFALYRRIASLREYVLIDPDTRRVEGFRRGADGLWVLHDMSDDDALSIPAIDIVVPLAELFSGLDPAAPPQ